MKLRGNTIFYSLMISSIIAVLMGGFLLVHSYQIAFIQPFYHQEIALENLLYVLEEQLSRGLPHDHLAIGLENTTDSASLHIEDWGLYKIVHGRGVHGREKWQRSCLAGQGFVKSRVPSLFLTDQKQPLIICGKTQLKGNLFLPSSGIRKGNIGRRYFEYPHLYEGAVFSSKNRKKPIQYHNLEHIQSILKGIIQSKPEPETYILENALIHHPWDSGIYTLSTPYSLEIASGMIQGKVMIISQGEIIIHPDAKLEHTLIIARSIRIKTGFQGVIQAYATDRLVIESKVNLGYPSVAGVFGHGDQASTLTIDSESQIEGGVIFDKEIFEAEPHRQDRLQIAKGAKVWGSVYASHHLELQGSVYGQVITDDFILETAGTQYKNYLLDAVIDPGELSENFAGPMIYPGKNFRVIEWLNDDFEELNQEDL